MTADAGLDAGSDSTKVQDSSPRRNSHNETTRTRSISTTDNNAARPSISKFATERPKPSTKTSLLPHAFLRQATNTSLLNEAIWTQKPSYSDDESSSSSSSEDDEPAQPKGAKRPQRKRGASAVDRQDFSRFNVGNDEFKTKGKVSRRDGRLNISVKETNNTGYLAKALGASFLKNITGKDPHEVEDESKTTIKDAVEDDNITRPKLNIVVMVIGSRGDIQPFLKLGMELKKYGHRVRIATHPTFKEFVENDTKLEFFSVGGDPAELMAFMVKNPGMIPTIETLRKGEVGRRRSQMAEMFEGFWRACINATDDEHDVDNLKMMGKKAPFIADAIIANPPCFAHIHCAERLGVPLHLMFTFPYTPTQAFPHPLANIKTTNVDPGYTNFMSYPLVE